MTARNVKVLANQWYSDFNRFAGDLYPGRYTFSKCQELAEQEDEAKRLSSEKDSKNLVHYYQYPEFHEIADGIGDSLALTRMAQKLKTKRVSFLAVAFMAQTYKMLNPSNRVYITRSTRELGCSLVFGTNHASIENWRKSNPTGIIISYINSDPYTKRLSNYITTSRNTAQIFVKAIKKNPGCKILFLSDKYLGMVMKINALRLLQKEGLTVDPDLIEIYQEEYNGHHASCYIHEGYGNNAVETAVLNDPEAELMIHPESECGCQSLCLVKIEEGTVSPFLSTEQMLQRARISDSNRFIVATEPGMLYALRKAMPDKTFTPVLKPKLTADGQLLGHCKYMKGNTFEGLIRSLREARIEIIICDNCTNCLIPSTPYEDEEVIHIPRKIAELARLGIEKGCLENTQD